jgi:hypothetical protein
MDFVLVQNGKAMGPLPAAKIRVGITSGEITKNAKIWRAPWNEWTKITNVFPIEFGLTADFVTKMEERGEIRHRPEQDLFERVAKQVPSGQIEEILRNAKSKLEDPLDIRVTARNKQELVYTNLRQALSKGHVAKETIEELIREATETGGQRIFLYRARRHLKSVSLGLSLHEVGVTLMGNDWTQTRGPQFHDLPPSPQISWLRAYEPASGGRSNPLGFNHKLAGGWILSIDATVRIDERIGGGVDGNITTHTYAPKLEAAVVILRYWEKLGLLELRVPNFEKRPLVIELRDKIYSEFDEKLLLSNKFEPWSLAGACTSSLDSLLHSPRREPTLKRVSGTRLREKDSSTMKIEIQNSYQEGIMDSEARTKSVDAYLAENSTVESVIATYEPSP